jgi:hypothetical protein
MCLLRGNKTKLLLDFSQASSATMRAIHVYFFGWKEGGAMARADALYDGEGWGAAGEVTRAMACSAVSPDFLFRYIHGRAPASDA